MTDEESQFITQQDPMGARDESINWVQMAEVLDIHDGELMPTLENRKEIIVLEMFPYCAVQPLAHCWNGIMQATPEFFFDLSKSHL